MEFIFCRRVKCGGCAWGATCLVGQTSGLTVGESSRLVILNPASRGCQDRQTGGLPHIPETPLRHTFGRFFIIRLTEHPILMRPRNNGANGGVITEIARRGVGFAIRIHLRLAGKNAFAHPRSAPGGQDHAGARGLSRGPVSGPGTAQRASNVCRRPAFPDRESPDREDPRPGDRRSAVRAGGVRGVARFD